MLVDVLIDKYEDSADDSSVRSRVSRWLTQYPRDSEYRQRGKRNRKKIGETSSDDE